MDIDEGFLTNKNQLPLTQLNYGGSSNRFSWILYQVGHLECTGKAYNAVYPSEKYEQRIKDIEDDVEENAEDITILQQRVGRNENDISAIEIRTEDNEDDIEEIAEVEL